MKNIKKYFGLTLLALFITAFSGCKEDDEFGSDNVGLGIKVFSPTKVVPGQPVTINGSGFGDVTEVEFPGGISVSNFELVSNEMIRVVTPKGINIAPEGEKLIVRTSNGKAESQHLMTQGHTQPRTYSAEEGGDVKIKGILKIFGKDMEFVNKATFMDKDGNDVIVQAKDFYRIATNSLSITIPSTVKEGHQIGSIETMDGKKFNLPDFNYVAAAGHWEIQKKILWENADKAAVAGWGGTFRFSNEETKTGEEIYAFPMEDWAVIKDGKVRVAVDCNEGSNIRITTGWWTGAYGGTEHNCMDFVQEDEDGTKYIELDIKEEGSLYDNIDAQHLLFTGDGYTVLYIYTQEEIWVEDAEGHWQRKSLWKRDGDGAVAGWGGTYRFSNVETSTGEEIYAFPMEDWALIKDGTVRVAVECNEGSNIRITTGWWTGAYGGTEHNCIDFVQEESDGTKYIELNIKEEGSLYDNIDAQHLLFTGDGYNIVEIYINEWVEEGAAKEVVIWENTEGTAVAGWGGTFRFSNEETSTGEEIYAIPMDQWSVIKDGTFYLLYDGDENSNVRITTGWWTGAYGGTDFNCIAFAEDDAATGKKVIKLNIKEDGNLYDNLDAQHLLFTGDGYTPLKIYYIK